MIRATDKQIKGRQHKKRQDKIRKLNITMSGEGLQYAMNTKCSSMRLNLANSTNRKVENVAIPRFGCTSLRLNLVKMVKSTRGQRLKINNVKLEERKLMMEMCIRSLGIC